MNTIRLLLAEDVRIFREMLQSIFNEQPDIHVVATVNESNAVLIRVRELDPDVVLLGMLYREEQALQLLRNLRTYAPRARVVVMDFRPAERAVVDFVHLGAHGFVLQDTPIDNMVHVVRLAAGRTADSTVELPQSQRTGDRLPPVTEPLAAFAGAFVLDDEKRAHLTKREEEVAGFICQGMSNRQIAVELHVSLHTVKCHVRRVLEKLELHSRAQIAAFGYQKGLPAAQNPL